MKYYNIIYFSNQAALPCQHFTEIENSKPRKLLKAIESYDIHCVNVCVCIYVGVTRCVCMRAVHACLCMHACCVYIHDQLWTTHESLLVIICLNLYYRCKSTPYYLCDIILLVQVCSFCRKYVGCSQQGFPH